MAKRSQRAQQRATVRQAVLTTLKLLETARNIPRDVVRQTVLDIADGWVVAEAKADNAWMSRYARAAAIERARKQRGLYEKPALANATHHPARTAA